MNRSLAYRCFTVLLVALLAGCGGGGGGDSIGTLPTSGTVQTSTPTPTQTAQMAVDLTYAGTGKTRKTASAASVGLPAATASVRIHLINPTTGADVIAPVLVARTPGALTQTVVLPNVPFGNYQIVVESLGAGDVALGYFHQIVAVAAATVTVNVDTSVTLVSLAITPLNATIGVGTTQVFLATATFSDSTTSVVNPLATWASSATTVAGIAGGTAVGLSAGVATITVYLNGQNASASLTVSGTIPTPTPTPNPSGSPTFVGTSVCGQCHIAFPPSNGYHAGDPVNADPTSNTYMDLAGIGSIYNNYVGSVHYTPAGTAATDFVQCEGCHGPGSLHVSAFRLVPYPIPAVAQCGSCHSATSPGTNVGVNDTVDITAFNVTPHANPSGMPDQYFFQGGVSATAQADYMGQPEWKDIQGTVPVTKNEHIEECSVCHSNNTKTSHIANDTLPNPPQVACGSCHDAHQPAVLVRNYVTTRAAAEGPATPDQQPNFIPVQVNNTAGSMFGAYNRVSGTWIRPRNYFAYKPGGNAANSFSGYTNQTTQGDWLRLSGERLCAACHTKGEYKYGRRYGSTNLTGTHNTDVFTQYMNSGHAAKTEAPWEEFSLEAPLAGTHRPQYPYDMGGKAGSGQNGTTVGFDGRMNGGQNNFDCNQCHHGIGTIDFLNGVQGGVALGTSNSAHILWGDQTATCITCHDPHKSGTGMTKNVRLPKYLSYNPEFKKWDDPTKAVNPTNSGNALGGQNTFLDLTPIPEGIGNSQLCLFCHQGRESGWTAWNKVRRSRVGSGDNATTASDFWYNSPNTVIKSNAFSYVNDHYLAAGAFLYGRNSTEFLGKTYSDTIPAHVSKNCTGCHMENANAASTEGGHTFKPVVTTCQTCHAGVSNFRQMFAQSDYNGNGAVQTAYDELGEVVAIPAATGHGSPLYGTATGGTGLFGLLNQALWDAGIEYDPDVYPYFYKSGAAHTSANAYKNWTPNQLAAAQNIQQMWKSGAAGQQGVYVHNPIYSAQVLIDSLEALGKTSGTANAFARPTQAAGGTTHTGRDYRTLQVTDQ